MIIYKVTNKINNKIYIGQTYKTAEQRLNDHYREAKSRYNNNKPLVYFHRALMKYGIENFEVEVIDTSESLEEINAKETYWINFYDSMNREIGYNRQSGGDNVEKSEETKKIISDKKKENWKDPQLAAKMEEGRQKAIKVWQDKSEQNKVSFICQFCGKELKLPPWETKNKKYCSQSCTAKATEKQRLAGAKKAANEDKVQRHKLYSQEVENWIKNNSETILNCPLNKISTNLSELQKIGEKYNITDWRTISQAICGKNTRKDLLVYLKEKCENVR